MVIETQDLEALAGQRIRDLRRELGLKQGELAAALFERGLKLPQSSVHRLEVGQRPLRVNEAAVIADFFKVSMESLWESASQPSEPELVSRRPASTPPLPLGWCAHCMASFRDEVPAVTMRDGTAMCADCNDETVNGMMAEAELFEEMIEDAKERGYLAPAGVGYQPWNVRHLAREQDAPE